MESKNITLNLPNKYRPTDFSDVVGQDHVVKVLEQQIKDKSLPPCIILFGPSGVGKTTISRIVARKLNPSPYGLIEKDSSIDGGKGDITDMQADVYNKPFIGEYKTYLLDEAHEITKKAFSSLLKVTEEPPHNVKFILTTTDFDKIPLNIKSRSQCHHLVGIKNTVIKNRINEIIKLEKQNIPDEVVNLVVEAGNGSLRNAIVALETAISTYLAGNTSLNLSDVLGILGSSRLANFLVAFLRKDFKEMFKLLPMFYTESIDAQRAINDLQQFITDTRMCLLMPKLAEEVKSNVSLVLDKVLDPSSSSKQDLLEQRRKLGSGLDSLFQLVLELESNLRRASNKEAVFTDFSVRALKTW